MKKEVIKHLTKDFESYSNQTQTGIEFWFARDLQHLLGYTEWRNFGKVINKAKTACEIAGHTVSNHFVDVNQMVSIGSGTEREIDDFLLTRFACYLIAQNGNPQKEQIAIAQHYFAVKTRKSEIIEKRIIDWERLQARQKLTLSEKELSELIFERTGNDKDFGMIRSRGDRVLFGYTTGEMKMKLRVPKNGPLADFLPTITIKAKDFATEITIFNIKDKNIQQGNRIAREHIRNNKGVRKLLLERGIKSEDKEFIKNPDKLDRDKNK